MRVTALPVAIVGHHLEQHEDIRLDVLAFELLEQIPYRHHDALGISQAGVASERNVEGGVTRAHALVVAFTGFIDDKWVTDLALKQGEDAWAVIKASDVMIGK